MAKIEQSIEVNVPVRIAYDQLTQFKDFPQFMNSVREIKQMDDTHLHWRAERNGKEVEWESEITEQLPGKVIAWRNTGGAKNIGRIVFQSPAPDRARVTMSFDSDDPATGEAGKASKQRLERDLQKFKEFIEAQFSETGTGRVAILEGKVVAGHTESDKGGASVKGTNGANGHNGIGSTNGNNGGRQETDHPAQRTGALQGLPTRQQSGQSSTNTEANMANQGDSMQFSGEVNQSRSPTQQSQSSMLAQAWSQPSRMMSQMTQALGQMPARMLEQEASMLQKSFASPQAWLPTMMNVWEEPFVMIRKMSEQMDQFFGKVLQQPISNIGQRHGGIMSRNWTPTVEISQRGNEMVICADLPGLTKDDVQLQVHDDKLTIEGERREDTSSQTAQGYHRTERSYGHFYRVIPLPEGVDGHAAQASMRDGVLEIVVPMQNQQRQGARLEIREAKEGELREQRDPQDVRQQREQYANQQTGQQREQQAGQQRDQTPEAQQRQGAASTRIEAKV